MSCSSNANRFSLASVKCGVSKIAASSAYASATMRSGIERAGNSLNTAAYATATAAAPTAGKVLGATTMLDLKGGGKWAIYGASLVFPPARNVARLMTKAEMLIGVPGRVAGNAIGDISRKELVSSTVYTSQTMGIFLKKSSAQAWSSRLTPLLNLNDLLTPADRENVTSSSGVVLKANNKTWHSGTTTVKTPAGERTITHVQSLTVPADHHYFNRPLNDREIVMVAGGQGKPAAMSGYAGGISGTEALFGPLVTVTKQAAIKARIFGGPAGEIPALTGPIGGVVTRLPSPGEANQALKKGQDWVRQLKEAGSGLSR